MSESREMRIKALFIPRSSLVEVMIGEARVVGIPPDAETLSVREDFMRNGLLLVLSHATYPLVREGDQMQVERCGIEKESLPVALCRTRKFQENLTDDERIQLWQAIARGYCEDCGSEHLPCHCTNDE